MKKAKKLTKNEQHKIILDVFKKWEGKKAKKSIKKKISGPTLVERLPKNHGEWLELAIKNTIKAIGPEPKASEKYLVDQKDRLINQLQEWKKTRSLS